MSADRAPLRQALARGEEEGGSIEFKTRLTRDTHLVDGRFESLAAQLRHRVLSGDGEATYVIGVDDDGAIAGISPDAFSESMDVLSLLAEEADAHIEDVETWGIEKQGFSGSRTRSDDIEEQSSSSSQTQSDDIEEQTSSGSQTQSDDIEEGIVGIAMLQEGPMLETDDEHVVVGTAGHVDHGKSTLVGTLVTGDRDDGQGDTRSFLDVQPHEVERGLSADLSYAVYGFDDEGPVRMDNPDRKTDRAGIVQEADRLVSFVDTVGHEPWLHTTIRGLVGQKLDYGLLAVAADDGPTETTREHLGILLATELPTLVAITKTDMVPVERVEAVEDEVETMLREVGETPLPVERHGIGAAIEEIGKTVPILRTSAVSGEGIDQLDTLFEALPKRESDAEAPFRMYVDRSYSVTGVGAVASGTVNAGTVEAGDELLLGPMPDGAFREVVVRSIEMHYHRVDKATAGRIVGIALKGVDEEEIERGMALVPRDSEPDPVREFEAEVVVLNHPTRIGDGYEPVVHLETVGEAAVFSPKKGRLLPGDTGRTTVRFKFRPYLVEEGQRFVFREGRSKGVGTVRSLETE